MARPQRPQLSQAYSGKRSVPTSQLATSCWHARYRFAGTGMGPKTTAVFPYPPFRSYLALSGIYLRAPQCLRPRWAQVRPAPADYCTRQGNVPQSGLRWLESQSLPSLRDGREDLPNKTKVCKLTNRQWPAGSFAGDSSVGRRPVK